MPDHICDKGPLIERLGEVLTRVDERTVAINEELARIRLAVLGNGVLGLTEHVERHAVRLEEVERTMLTHDVVKKLVWRMGAMAAGAVGLTATIISIIDHTVKTAP